MSAIPSVDLKELRGAWEGTEIFMGALNMVPVPCRFGSLPHDLIKLLIVTLGDVLESGNAKTPHQPSLIRLY